MISALKKTLIYNERITLMAKKKEVITEAMLEELSNNKGEEEEDGEVHE